MKMKKILPFSKKSYFDLVSSPQDIFVILSGTHSRSSFHTQLHHPHINQTMIWEMSLVDRSLSEVSKSLTWPSLSGSMSTEMKKMMSLVLSPGRELFFITLGSETIEVNGLSETKVLQGFEVVKLSRDRPGDAIQSFSISILVIIPE
jgi:hypothetical protein